MNELNVLELKEVALEIEKYFKNYPRMTIDEFGNTTILVAKLIGYIKAL